MGTISSNTKYFYPGVWLAVYYKTVWMGSKKVSILTSPGALHWYNQGRARPFGTCNPTYFSVLGLINHDSHGDVIMDPKVIASRYLKSWFAIDFLSSLPLDYFFLAFEGQGYNAGRALRILRLAKLLQLLRLLRISRLVRYIRIWQEVSMIVEPLDNQSL